MGIAPEAEMSSSGFPNARALYGPIPAQLEQPDSFASQPQRLLRVRSDHRIYAARQIDVPDVEESRGLLVMVHELADGRLLISLANYEGKSLLCLGADAQ